MRSAERITTYVDPEIGRALHRLCLERGAAKARVVAEALREYIAARSADPELSLLAREPRREGRPSRVDLARRARREAALRKRAGRPLRITERPERAVSA